MLARVLPSLYMAYMRIVEATSTVDLRDIRRVLDKRAPDERIAIALLHQDVLAAPWFFRDRQVTALAQRSDAGEIIAAVLARIGFAATARGGTSASPKRRNPIVHELVRGAVELGGNAVIAITPDGSSGPAGVVRPGIAYFALRTRATVYCVKISASRALHAPTWDRTLIPLPFGTIRIHVSPPLAPPAERPTVTDFERYRRQIEDHLHRLHHYAYDLIGKSPVPRLSRLQGRSGTADRSTPLGSTEAPG